MASPDLENDIAVITGASSGIGRVAAEQLAAEGANVALAARSEDDLQELAASIRSEWSTDTLVLPTDVTEEEEVSEMVESVVDEFGGIDLVVNNAGVGRPGPLEEMSSRDYHAIMDVNTDGMFFTARETIPHLHESQGNLIFMGSGAGRRPISKYAVYAASKWWTRGLALSLAGQIGDDIGVTIVNPGNTRSEFGSEYRDPNREHFEKGEALEVEDVGKALVFAAKQEPPAVISEIDVRVRGD